MTNTSNPSLTRDIVRTTLQSDPALAAELGTFLSADQTAMLERRSLGSFTVHGEEDGVLYGRQRQDAVANGQRGPTMTDGSVYEIRAGGEIDKNGWWGGGQVDPTSRTDEGQTRLQLAVVRDGELLSTHDFEPNADGVMQFQNVEDGAELHFYFLDGGLSNNSGSFEVDVTETQIRAQQTNIAIVADDAEGIVAAGRAIARNLDAAPAMASIPAPDPSRYANDVEIDLAQFLAGQGVIEDASLRPTFGTDDYAVSFQEALQAQIAIANGYDGGFANNGSLPQQFNSLEQVLQAIIELVTLAQLTSGMQSGAYSNRQAANNFLPARPAPQRQQRSSNFDALSADLLIQRALQGDRRRTQNDPGAAARGRHNYNPAASLIANRVASADTSVDKAQMTRDAIALHEAIDGAGTTESTLNDIIGNRTNAELAVIKSTYQSMYGESLVDAVQGDTSGNYENTLVAMLKGERKEGPQSAAQVTRDAVALHEAIDGWGTTDSTLISIMTGRSGAHLQKVAAEYESMYGESLQDAIEGDTSGQYETLLVSQIGRNDEPTRSSTPGTTRTPGTPTTTPTRNQTETRATRAAAALHEAIDGGGTNEQALINQLSNLSNAEMTATKAAYQEMYGESLQDAIEGDTSGQFESLLVDMLRGNRDESGRIDPNQITRDAAAIHEAIDGAGTDDAALRQIFSTRSGAQLQEIGKVYEDMYGESLTDAVEGDTSGWYETALLAQIGRTDARPSTTVGAPGAIEEIDLNDILAGNTPAVQRVDPQAERQARATRTAVALHTAMDGGGTDEQQLINLLSNLGGEDMRAVKAAYQGMYGESLQDAIESDTSGQFENYLVALLNSNRNMDAPADREAAMRSAVRIHEAIDGWGTTDSVLVSELSRNSPEQIRAIAQAYREMYDSSMKGDIEGDTGGWFETALVHQLNVR